VLVIGMVLVFVRGVVIRKDLSILINIKNSDLNLMTRFVEAKQPSIKMPVGEKKS
jgi:hypothetical protein